MPSASALGQRSTQARRSRAASTSWSTRRPGRTSASTPREMLRDRGPRADVGAERQPAPQRARANAPCSASTPTFTWWPPRRRRTSLPAPLGELDVERVDLLAAASPRRARGTPWRRCRRRGSGWSPRRSPWHAPAGSTLLKMPLTDEHRLRAELHHERGVGRRGDAARAEQRHRELAASRRPPARDRSAPAAPWPSRRARPSRPA